MLDGKRVLRVQALVLLLAALAIGLFLLIYVGLGALPQAPRLFAALCAPPVLIGLAVGLWWLRTQRGQDAPPAA